MSKTVFLFGNGTMEGKVDLKNYIICQLENHFKIIEFILAFKNT